MKMRTYWENERRKLLGQPLIQDTDNQENTAIDAPLGAVLRQGEEDGTMIVKPEIGILQGFYVGATNLADLERAKNDIIDLIPPQDRLRINLRFDRSLELPHLCKVTLVSLVFPLPGQIQADADYTPNNNDDAGVRLIGQLCTSSNGYLYQIATYAPQLNLVKLIDSQEIDFKGRVKYGIALNQVNPTNPLFGENGAANYSTTKRSIQTRGERLIPNGNSHKPLAQEESDLFIGNKNPNQNFGVKSTAVKIVSVKTLFDAVTTLHPRAVWDEVDQNNNVVPKPRGATVFHELWEIWERTDKLLPYAMPQFDVNGNAINDGLSQREDLTPAGISESAHYKAVSAETNFWNRSLQPGGFIRVRF